MTQNNPEKKTIKLTFEELEQLSYNPKFGQAVTQKFPVKTAYWLGRGVEKITRRMKEFQKVVNEIVDEYALKVENEITGDMVPKLRPDNQPDWGDNQKEAQARLKELREIEVDLEIQPITLDLDRCEEMGLTITAETFALLMPFLEDKDA